MKTTITILTLLAGIVCFNSAANAQLNKLKQIQQNEIMYSTSSSTNDIKSLTTVKPQETEFSSEKKNLLRQLEDARNANNIDLKVRLEAELHKLNGISTVQLIQDPNAAGGPAANSKVPFNNEQDFLSSQIVSGGIWASAFQTETLGMPHQGRMWVAAAIGNLSGTDTCKIYYSDDLGQTWTFAYVFYFSYNMDFNQGQLDIELAYDGSTLWIYGVAGCFNFVNGRLKPVLFRVNSATGILNVYNILWPGNSYPTNYYYYPRITSDNINYTGSTYIYISCSFDSAVGSTDFARQKYALIENPFAALPTIQYSQPGPNGGFFWNTSGLPTNDFLWTDIGYFRTSGGVNRIMTVYNVPFGHTYNMYLAWSDDYGATITGSSSLTEAHPDFGAKIAFTGWSSSFFGMIAYVRQFSGNDWDPYCRYTSNNGANWANNYIDRSLNRTRTVDIIAHRNAIDIFDVTYAQDSSVGPVGYYTGGSGDQWTQPPLFPITPSGVDTLFTKVIAGYNIFGGYTDQFALYSTGFGTNLYGSRTFQSLGKPKSVDGGIPNGFTLSQNYPNPFNPSTKIKFDVPDFGKNISNNVTIKVYDIEGREVASLVNSNLKPGSYETTFDGSNYSSGIYFYKLVAGDFVETKKMMLVK